MLERIATFAPQVHSSVSDPSPAPGIGHEDKRGLLQKIAEFLHPGPDSHEELYNTLSQAEHNQVISAESRIMLEGVIRIANLTAGGSTNTHCWHSASNSSRSWLTNRPIPS